MFTPDRAIKTQRDDILGRAPFARFLADAIISYSDRESILIGLFGEWGSGKTSAINMMLEHIREVAQEKPEYNPRVIRFNPWTFSGQNNLTYQFFRQMASVLSPDCNTGSKISEKLAEYASCFLVTDNTAGGILPDNMQSGSSCVYHSFMHIRDELDDIFAADPDKTIVIIDDIDRLSNAEILQVFQIVKVMADFPNTIYVASMDKNVVIKALEKIRESSGVEYLEKMVQVPFEIPLISKEEVENTLLSRIKELVSQATDNKLDEIYWGNLYHGGLKKFFRGIRDVTRYVNNLKFGFDMVKNEVNLVDFLAVTALQVFAPEVYFGIRDNKNLFTGIFDTESPSAQSGRESITEIINRSRNVDPELLQELLKRMFPKLETIFEEIGYDEEWLPRWRKEGRICSREMFDVYFRLSLGEGTISRRRVRQVFSLAGDQKEFAAAIIEINDEGNLGSFMTLFENYAGEFPVKHIPNVVFTLMDLGDLFPEEDPGLAVVNTSMRVLHMVYEILHRLETREARFECFVNTINNAKNSLYTMIKQVESFDQQHAGTEQRDLPWPEERQTLNESQVQELKNLLCAKIGEWAESGRLRNHPDLAQILNHWAKWGHSEQASAFTNKLIESDTGLLDYVYAYFKTSSLPTTVDLDLTAAWKLNLYKIQKMTDINRIDRRLRVIASYPGFARLDKYKRLSVRAFLLAMDQQRKKKEPQQ